MKMNKLVLTVLAMTVALGVYATAQSGGAAKAKPAMQKAAKAKVMFLEPKNGATVTSPVHMKFGSSGTTISPVPAGDVKEPRPGMAHYHVGIDQPCLAPG